MKHPVETRVEELIKKLDAIPCQQGHCHCDVIEEAISCIRAMDLAGKQLGRENRQLRAAIGMATSAISLIMDDCDTRRAN